MTEAIIKDKFLDYLVDSHCHLDHLESNKYNANIDDIITNATKNNVRYMQTICTHISKFPDILAIANKYDNVFCSVGIHPHEAESEYVTLDELIKFTEHKKVIGIGETGLDYYYEHSNRTAQKERFVTHIQAARATQLPLIVHSRDADDDMINILTDEMKKAPFPFLIHCFSGTKKLCDKMLAIGGYISISGIITFKNSHDLREIVKNVPLDRLLVETDSPFLAPIPFRGKMNQPSYTKNVAEILAQVKSVSLQEITHITSTNFHNLFKI